MEVRFLKNVRAATGGTNANAAVLPEGWAEAVKVNGPVPMQVYASGPRDAPALLLIHGLGQCVTDWPVALVSRLSKSFRVVAFDNRDVGRSARLDHFGTPPLLRLWLGKQCGFRLARPAYTIADMARDALRVCETMDIGRVHCVGASMGGMVAQRLALLAPQRVASLALIMSSSGAPDLPKPVPAIQRMMRAGGGANVSLRDAAAATTRLREALATELSACDREELSRRVYLSVAYGWPVGDGVARQFAAIFDDYARADEICTLDVPTLVVHGTKDPLLPIAHGRDLAARLGASFEEFPSMGHEITASVSTRLADLIIAHVDGLSAARSESSVG